MYHILDYSVCITAEPGCDSKSMTTLLLDHINNATMRAVRLSYNLDHEE